jgi:hypothetical protein
MEKILYLLQSMPNAHSTILVALANVQFNMRLETLKFRCGYSRKEFSDTVTAASPATTNCSHLDVMVCSTGCLVHVSLTSCIDWTVYKC